MSLCLKSLKVQISMPKKSTHLCIGLHPLGKDFQIQSFENVGALGSPLFAHHASTLCVFTTHGKNRHFKLPHTYVLCYTLNSREQVCALKAPVQQCPVSHARCSPPLRLHQCCCCSPSTAIPPTALPRIIRR